MDFFKKLKKLKLELKQLFFFSVTSFFDDFFFFLEIWRTQLIDHYFFDCFPDTYLISPNWPRLYSEAFMVKYKYEMILDNWIFFFKTYKDIKSLYMRFKLFNLCFFRFIEYKVRQLELNVKFRLIVGVDARYKKIQDFEKFYKKIIKDLGMQNDVDWAWEESTKYLENLEREERNRNTLIFRGNGFRGDIDTYTVFIKKK